MRKNRAGIAAKVLTVILAVLMLVSVLPVGALAAGDQITVYVTVSGIPEGGRISTYNTEENEACMLPVTLSSGAETLDDAFKAVNLNYYGSASGYATENGTYGAYVTKFWGVATNGNCGYNVNGTMASGLSAALKDGDNVEFFLYEGNYYSGTLESYAKFGSFSKSVVAGGSLDFNLEKAQYDTNYNIYYAPVSGASVRVCKEGDTFKNVVATTDVNGNFSLDFEEAGTYYITAVKDGTTVTEITAPICRVTVYDFQDIAGHWGESFIRTAVSQGLFSGMSATSFAPDSGMTRAMVAMVLYKLSGSPAVTGPSEFTDVPAGAWYTDAVTWAKENGIASGYGGGLFGPEDPVTREQFVMMLNNYAVKNSFAMGATEADLSLFADGGSVSSWANAAMQWANANGYIKGTSGMRLNPQGTLTRAECATILSKFYPRTVGGSIYKTASYLKDNVSPATGSVGGDWTMLALGQSGNASAAFKTDYFTAVRDLVTSKQGVLSTTKYTEYSRTIIGVTASGNSAVNVAGYDLTKPLADFDKVTEQGIVGAAYALIALNCGGYSIPTDSTVTTQATKRMYVDYITSRVLSDGGFAITGTTADPDVTAIVIQALATYKFDTAVKAVINGAVAKLSAMQSGDGSFQGYNGKTCETCAQVIIALTMVGISPDSTDFTKNGNTVMDAMLKFMTIDGSFEHTMGGGSDMMATEQAMMAMTSAQMFSANETNLYFFGD